MFCAFLHGFSFNKGEIFLLSNVGANKAKVRTIPYLGQYDEDQLLMVTGLFVVLMVFIASIVNILKTHFFAKIILSEIDRISSCIAERLIKQPISNTESIPASRGASIIGNEIYNYVMQSLWPYLGAVV